MTYKLLYHTARAFSLLPLWLLYGISDLLFYLVYYVAGYRRAVVRDNLRRSFPEKSERERLRIEKDFFHFLTDYMVETVKLLTIPKADIKRRVTFEGIEEMLDAVKSEGKHFGFIYFAHYGNWEWIATLTERIHEKAPAYAGAQIYHPLRSAAFDRLFLHIRSRFGGDNVKMKETLRYILRHKSEGKDTLMGFIADQAPGWNSIHHWNTFLGQTTPVFTGTEQIGRKVDALLFYAQVTRPRRGYYHVVIRRMPEADESGSDYPMTDAYFSFLENDIRRTPHLWLWSHKRWKRTYEEFLKRNSRTAQ